MQQQNSSELPQAAEDRQERLVPVFRCVFPDPPSLRESARGLDGQDPRQELYTAKTSLSGKSILLSLKGLRVRKFQPRCKHLQTEVYFFFYLCTWNEHWKGKTILILSWQCLSPLPKAEIIISLVVTQLLREVIHLIFLYNHSTGFYLCRYWNWKMHIACPLSCPFQVPYRPGCGKLQNTPTALRKLNLCSISAHFKFQASCLLVPLLNKGRKSSCFKFLFKLRQWRLKTTKLLPLLSST